MKYRVSFDRPRGLSPDGYHALVNEEPGPHGFAHIAAICRKWNVTAGLREWNAHSFYVGRVDASGALKKAPETHSETRAYHEKQQAARLAYEKKTKREEDARLREHERRMRKIRGK